MRDLKLTDGDLEAMDETIAALRVKGDWGPVRLNDYAALVAEVRESRALDAKLREHLEWIEGLQATGNNICGACKAPVSPDEIGEHMRTCEKHPLREALTRAESAERDRDGMAAQLAEHRRALLALLGPDRLTDEDWQQARTLLDRPLPAAAERVRVQLAALEAWRVADADADRAWVAYRGSYVLSMDGVEAARSMANDAEARLRRAESNLRAALAPGTDATEEGTDG